MKRKYKQQSSTVPPISTKRTTPFQLKSMNTKQIAIYGVNSGKGIPKLTLLMIIFPKAIQI